MLQGFAILTSVKSLVITGAWFMAEGVEGLSLDKKAQSRQAAASA